MEKTIQFANVFGEKPVNLTVSDTNTVLDIKKAIIGRLKGDLNPGEQWIGSLFKMRGSDLLVLFAPSFGIFKDQTLMSQLPISHMKHLLYHFVESQIFTSDNIILENGSSFSESAITAILYLSETYYPLILPKSQVLGNYSLKDIIRDQMKTFNIHLDQVNNLNITNQRTGKHLSLIDADDLHGINNGDLLTGVYPSENQPIEDSIQILESKSGEDDLDIRIFDDIDIIIKSDFEINQVQLVAVKGNIVNQRVSAIVTAANANLIGGGGVDGAIHAAAGPQLVRASKYLSPCEPGSAVLTPGFNLPTNWVIHAVGPIYRDGKQNEDKKLVSAYETCLDIAIKSGFESIAFPAISTGVYGFPPIPAARLAINTTIRKVRTVDQQILRKVVFVLFSDQDLQIYQQILSTVSNEND